MKTVNRLFDNVNRLSALRTFNLRTTRANHTHCKIAWAKVRRTIKESKRSSWRQKVSRLNSRSTVKKTWDMVRKIQGKNSCLSVKHLNTADGVATSKEDIANTLADSFAKNLLLKITLPYSKNSKSKKRRSSLILDQIIKRPTTNYLLWKYLKRALK